MFKFFGGILKAIGYFFSFKWLSNDDIADAMAFDETTGIEGVIGAMDARHFGKSNTLGGDDK